MAFGQSAKFVCILVSVSVIIAMEMTMSEPTKCLHTENIFNCSGIGLFGIPAVEDVPLGIESLDVSFNTVRNISFSDYRALSKTLTTLNLSNNQISQMYDDTFSGFTNLIFIDLSNNFMFGSTLDDMVFTDQRKLLYLTLRNNPLRLIKKDTFNFMELPELTHLDLSHCEIIELEPDSFDVRSLEYLDLSWNELQTFDKKAFRMLPSLKTLDLSQNRIVVLNKIPYMPALVTWILDANRIETIVINEEVEDYADNLQELYLRDNNILRFNVDSLPLKLEDLAVIDMSDNRLHCDCRMRWIKSKEYDFQKKNYTFTCSYPSSVSGRNLLSLSPNELTCGISLVKILIFVLICVVAFTTLSLVAFFVVRSRRRRKKLKRAARGDEGGDYTAVYSRDEDDVRVSMSDNKHLLETDINREFDV